MQVSTGGIHVKSRKAWLRGAVELVSSMRFAISLLTIIAVASAIGTVLKQNEPLANYVNQFGGFWFEVFSQMGLYAIYNTAWFLLILAFLVLSTSLCLVRNSPKMLRDMREWRDQVREASLRAHGHKLALHTAYSRADFAMAASTLLQRRGFKVKQSERGNETAGATLLAAKAGTWNRLGYIFAHAAIIVICLGGLLDSDMPIKFQMFFMGKTPVRGETLMRDIPLSARLSPQNPTFRGNSLVAEGETTHTVAINVRDRVLIQDLPFALKLKHFVVQYYSTGMPKLFSSEVEVHDPETGKDFTALVEVNKPLIYRGVAIYQSSFEDGGSHLRMTSFPMLGSANTGAPITGDVGAVTTLKKADGSPADFSIEFSEFRAINVENLAEAGAGAQAKQEDKFKGNVAAVISSGLGSGAHSGKAKDLHNVGPSLQYKLRDPSGQAREYRNYMLPVELDGFPVFLAGMRESPDDPFGYMRIPADDNGSVGEFMRLRAALADPAMRAEAARRFSLRALPPATPDTNAALRERLTASTIQGLATFAGDVDPKLNLHGGYNAIAAVLDRSVPKGQQEQAVEAIMKTIGGSLWELWQMSHERAHLPPIVADQQHGRYMQLVMNALSDSFFYGAPIYLQLDSFDQVQASVFQMTRSPGRKVVYLGCILLVLGVFAMFYIRERRVWVWIREDGERGREVLFAMSTTRPTLDFEKEFVRMSTDLGALAE